MTKEIEWAEKAQDDVGTDPAEILGNVNWGKK